MSLSKAARAELLTLSPCPAAEIVDLDSANAAIRATLKRYGFHGSIEAFAQEMGDHPDDCTRRMSWAIAVIAVIYPDQAPSPSPMKMHDAATPCQSASV